MLLQERRQARKERRITDLSAIKRFREYPDIPHRFDLDVHSQQVSMLSRDLGQYLASKGVAVDLQKVAEQGYYHDDPEVITGDIPKSKKMNMSKDEKRNLQKAEDRANRKLAKRYFGFLPTTEKRRYKEYYRETSQKVTVEARIVNITDKIIGLSETIHNMRCGADYLAPVLENYRTIFQLLHEEEALMKYLTQAPYNLDMKVIPTAEKARTFSKVKPRTSESSRQSEQDFWDGVFDNSLPEFFRHWMGISLQLGKSQLFPGWKEKNPKPFAVTVFP